MDTVPKADDNDSVEVIEPLQDTMLKRPPPESTSTSVVKRSRKEVELQERVAELEQINMTLQDDRDVYYDRCQELQKRCTKHQKVADSLSLQLSEVLDDVESATVRADHYEYEADRISNEAKLRIATANNRLASAAGALRQRDQQLGIVHRRNRSLQDELRRRDQSKYSCSCNIM